MIMQRFYLAISISQLGCWPLWLWFLNFLHFCCNERPQAFRCLTNRVSCTLCILFQLSTCYFVMHFFKCFCAIILSFLSSPTDFLFCFCENLIRCHFSQWNLGNKQLSTNLYTRPFSNLLTFYLSLQLYYKYTVPIYDNTMQLWSVRMFQARWLSNYKFKETV